MFDLFADIGRLFGGDVYSRKEGTTQGSEWNRSKIPSWNRSKAPSPVGGSLGATASEIGEMAATGIGDAFSWL